MAGDFKLLEAYIQLNVTPSIARISASFDALMNKIRTATNKNYNIKIGLQTQSRGAGAGGVGGADLSAPMERTAKWATLFEMRLNRARAYQGDLNDKANRYGIIQAKIGKYLATHQLSMKQRLGFERQLATASEREAAIRNRITRDAARKATMLRQGVASLSLELGFLFGPIAQKAGNFARIGADFSRVGESLGMSIGMARIFSLVMTTLTGIFKAFVAVMKILASVLLTVATVALRTFIAALRLVFAPTLAFLRLIQQVIANLPLLAVAIGGLVTRRVIEYGKQLERITNTFRLAFGSSAAKQLDFVRAAAARLGLPLQDIADQYSRIAFAGQAAGISQKDLRQLFEGVGTASIALGLDAERIGGIFFALEQVISKGTLSSEELRRQLGDRLPAAFQIAARAMGVTTDQLNKMLKGGEIDSKRFISNFGRELNRTFGAAARRQMFSLTASINRMNTAIFEVGISFAEKVKPAIAEVVIELTKFLDMAAKSQGFRTFALFVRDQFRVLALAIPQIANALVAFGREMGPLLLKVGKALLVLNSLALGVLSAAFQRVLRYAKELSPQVDSIVKTITGLDLSKISFSLATMKASFEAGGAMLDILITRLKELPERLAASWRAFSYRKVMGGMIAAFIAIGKLFGWAILEGFKSSARGERFQPIVDEAKSALVNLGLTIKENFGGVWEAFKAPTSFEDELRLQYRRLRGIFRRSKDASEIGADLTPLKVMGRQIGVMEKSWIKMISKAATLKSPFGKLLDAPVKKADDSFKSSIVRLEDIRASIEDSLLERDKTAAIIGNTEAVKQNTTVLGRLVNSIGTQGKGFFQQQMGDPGSLTRTILGSLPGGGLIP